MTKRSHFKILVVALVALLLLPGAALAQTPVTLMHGWTGADNTEMLNIVFDQYNMENEDGIVIEPTALNWDDLFSQVVLTAAAGNPPDVVMFHNSEVPEFVARGILLPIDDLMAQVEVDLEGVAQNIIDLSIVDGDFYCLPGDLHPMNLYYNVDLVEAAGLDPDSPPAIGEEFLAWAEAMTLTDDDGRVTQYGLDLQDSGATIRWLFHALVHQFGGQFMGEDGLSAYNSEAGHQALQWIVDLHNTGHTSRGLGFGDVSAFYAGRAGTVLLGSWRVNSIMHQEFRFDSAVMPTVGSQPAAWANTHCLALTRQDSDENYLNAMKVVKWFYDNYALPAVSVGIIPVSPTAQADPIFTDDERYQYYIPFIESLQFAALEPAFPQYTSVFSFGKPTPLSINLEAAIAGDKTVEEALADMKEGIDEILTEDM